MTKRGQLADYTVVGQSVCRQSVTSHKEMDTINELLGVDLVWFDTIQKR